MKISSKLILLTTIPLIAFLAISILYAKISIDESDTVDKMSGNTQLFIAISDLVHELQKERGRTSIYLSGGSQDDMNSQRKLSDNQIKPVIDALKTANLTPQVKEATSQAVSNIEKVRTQANQNSPVREVVDAYGKIIADLMTSETAIANSKTTRGFGKSLTTIIILETAKENAGKLRATVSGILTADKPINEEMFTRLITFKSNIDANLESKALVLGAQAHSILDENKKSQAWLDTNKWFNTVLVKSKEGNFGINGKDFFSTITQVIDSLNSVRTKEMITITNNLTTIQNEISSSLTKVYVVIGTTLILSLLIAFFVAKSITNPIKHLIQYAQKVSGGNLEAEISEKFSHELGSLKSSLNTMISNLKTKISEAETNSRKAEEESLHAKIATREAEEAKIYAEQAKAEGMNAAANSIENVVEIVSSASEELSAQIEQSTQGAEIQSQRVAETATAMEQMNATVMEVAKNASQAAETADQAKHQAQEGEKVVTEVVTGIAEVQSTALELKNDMTLLGKRAEEIGQILNVISDIADQTNLLALNAAIEAARAGDAGRGFAVVADEVRKLAEKTMSATKEVGDSIRGIQNEARKNIENVDLAVSRIGTVTSLATKSGNSLEEIVKFVDLTTDQVRAIATASEEQSATSEEINRSIEDVNRVSMETSDAMRQSAQAVGELANQAQVLKRLIDEMKSEGSDTRALSGSSPKKLA
ncbi:methyl-accepting chemotaxis protein [Solidesulfovibrio carbinolicus]|nr:methyl-accepting chemotaxis protein [Solidesulfovibrio carbinolicus]